MALYPGTHKISTVHVNAYTPSCGASPVATYIRAPFRARIMKYAGILGGALTTADGTVTVANVTQGTTIGTFTLTQSGSTAGKLFSNSPASPTYVNEDDVISFTPAGASGATIPLHVSASFKSA